MRGGRSRHRCRWGRERRGPQGSGVGVSASEPPTTQQPHEKWKQVPAAQSDPSTPLARAHGSQTERDPRGRTSRSWQSHATEKRSVAKRDGRWGPRVRSHGPHVRRESGPGPSTPQLRFHGAQEPSRASRSRAAARAGARGRPLEGRRPPQSRPRCGLHGLMRLSQSPQPQVRSGHTADCRLRVPVLKALAVFGGRPCVRVRGNPPAFPPGDSVNALRSPWRTILTPPVGVHRGPDIPRVRLVRQTCSRRTQMVVERHSLQNCSWWQKK